jgi:lysophospholipase L1-like esterase
MPNASSFGAQTENAVVQGTVTDRQMIIPEIPPQGLMSVGPRVSFNFLKLWNEKTDYHYYDVVQNGAGASYIAIKPFIPAGTELVDGEFWRLWAEPNEQISDLRHVVELYDARIKGVENAVVDNKTQTDAQIKAVENAVADNKTQTDAQIKVVENAVGDNKTQIDALKKNVYDGIYLCLGDSWVAGGEIAGIVSAQKNLKLINKAVSGASFTKFESYVKTVDEEIDEAFAEIERPNDVKLVTVVCSVNDVSHIKQDTSTQSKINTETARALKKIRAKFPKAEIIFAADAPYSSDFLSLSYYYYSVDQMQKVAYNNNVTFVNLADMFNDVSFYKSDNLHPNQLGYGFVASALLHGDYKNFAHETYSNEDDTIYMYYNGAQVIINYTFKAGETRSLTLPRNLALKTILSVPRTSYVPTLTKNGDTCSNYANTINIPRSTETIYGFFICATIYNG